MNLMQPSQLTVSDIFSGQMATFFNGIALSGPCVNCGEIGCSCQSSSGAANTQETQKSKGSEKISDHGLAAGMTSDLDYLNNLLRGGQPDGETILEFLHDKLKSADINLGAYVSQSYEVFLQAGNYKYAALLHNIFSAHIDMETGLPHEPEKAVKTTPQVEPITAMAPVIPQRPFKLFG